MFIIKGISTLDFLGKPFQFRLKGHENFKTFFGGTLSFIVFTLTFLLGISFLVQLFTRSNFSINLSTSAATRPRIDFEEKLPIVFIVNNINVQIFPDQDQILDIIGYSYNLNESFGLNINYFNITKCSKDYISNNYGIYADYFFKSIPSSFINSGKIFCLEIPKKDYYIYSSYGSPPEQFIMFALAMCNNKTANNTCKSVDQIKIELAYTQIALFFPDTYIDHRNYENPGQIFLNSKGFLVSTNLFKRFYLNLKPINYLSDDGLVLSSVSNKTYFQLDSVSQDINLPGAPNRIPNIIAAFYFTMSSPVTYIYSRQYMNIPQLLASLGGAFNSLYIISLLLNYYVEKKSKEIDIFDLCCGQLLVKKNNDLFKVISNNQVNQLKPENTIKVNTYMNHEITENSRDVSVKNSKKMNEIKKLFEISNKSVIFENPEIENLARIEMNFLEKIFDCFRSPLQNKKMKLSREFTNQIFEISFLFGNVLENQIIHILNSKLGNLII